MGSIGYGTGCQLVDLQSLDPSVQSPVVPAFPAAAFIAKTPYSGFLTGYGTLIGTRRDAN